MNRIEVQLADITAMDTDIIVNAANSSLQWGGGVCGAIFAAADGAKLQAACNAIGHCATGSAVITDSFGLKAKYIIHAVGPVWQGGGHDEAKHLDGCYWESLCLAYEKGCHSIAFPLISSGIYGYPKEEAWEVALSACRDFLDKYPDADMRIVFTVIGAYALRLGSEMLARVAPQYAG